MVVLDRTTGSGTQIAYGSNAREATSHIFFQSWLALEELEQHESRQQVPPSTHRGVAHEVVERKVPKTSTESDLPWLPTRWNDDDKCNGIDIKDDGLNLSFRGIAKSSDDAAAVRTDHPIPRSCGFYYFEVSIEGRNKEGYLGDAIEKTKVKTEQAN